MKGDNCSTTSRKTSQALLSFSHLDIGTHAHGDSRTWSLRKHGFQPIPMIRGNESIGFIVVWCVNKENWRKLKHMTLTNIQKLAQSWPAEFRDPPAQETCSWNALQTQPPQREGCSETKFNVQLLLASQNACALKFQPLLCLESGLP